ncbi:OmpH family outer membrane protein [Parabacteroides sp. OttesenSCG-928-G21]|nr:OmpH family outer membrane protein [Parabacteroides sp. OttesenSCG-928-G21]
MKKIIALMVIMLLPLGAIAQNTKTAYVFAQEVMVIMPEYTEMINSINALSEGYRKELQQMEEEYRRKYTDFVNQQDSLTENIRLRRMQELQDMETRVETLVQAGQEEIDAKQQELIRPIQEKLRNAIRAVGEEKKYVSIIDPQALLYYSDDMEDATPFVKAKLGL